MPTYAHVLFGSIAELFVPPDGFTIEQCFHPDLQWVDVTAFNPLPHPGWSAQQDSSGNWTFSPPAPPPGPTLADQARDLQNAGLAVTSTATPALNGTYAADDLSWANIIAIETSLIAGKGFPGGASTMPYPDKSGAFHVFTADDFTNMAVAMRDFVFAVKVVINGAPGATLPSNSATIA